MKKDLIQQIESLTPKLTKSGKTRSQVGKGSKSKGKTGERHFADILSKYSELEFIRVPNSGAFVGQSNRERLMKLSRTQRLINLGDIIAPEELMYSFIIESKNYADLDFHNLLNIKNNTTVIGWLDELLYDCESHFMFKKDIKPLISILGIKITRKGSYAVFNESLKLETSAPFLTFKHEIKHESLIKNGFTETFYLMDFEEFCKHNKEKLFKRIEI